jgi:hypothetical protein
MLAVKMEMWSGRSPAKQTPGVISAAKDDTAVGTVNVSDLPRGLTYTYKQNKLMYAATSRV